jgi:hypothetical protein
MSNNTGDDFNFCISFKMALQLRTMLLGQLRDVPLSAVEWDIVRSRPQSEESPTKSPNTQSTSVLKYVEDRLAILKGHDIIKNKVDWYYACQLCNDIIQHLNA